MENYDNLRNAINDIQKSINSFNGITTDFNDLKEDVFDKIIEQVNNLKQFNIYELRENIRGRLIYQIHNISKGFVFERVIFDEADSIKIPNSQPCYSKRMWCVTSSIDNLIYPKGFRKHWDKDYQKRKI